MKKYIPDCYYPETTPGQYVSHEAICLLNPGDEACTVTITLYFEDRDKMGPFVVEVGAERTNHVRMDRITDAGGNRVPRATPYAAVVECEQEIAVQYTRVDTTQNNLALMTAMA